MIIVKLKSGLGNQLFQYAAARKLSVHHNTSLKLDTSFFENDKLRAYRLNHFCIKQAFASHEEIAAVKRTERIRFLARHPPTRKALSLLELIERSVSPSIFHEEYLRPYNPSILKTPRDLYLEGYFESEKYFLGIEDVIRREFAIRSEPDVKNLELADEISKSESVSIHVRRGDFAQIPAFGMCSPDYYAQCVAKIAEMVTTPNFFIFSDDHDWIVEHVRPDYPTTYVTHNDATKDYEDLRLMSLCKHNIIANSTFSWWAAWLNVNPNKIVLAPRTWFKDPVFDTRDLIPSAWIKI